MKTLLPLLLIMATSSALSASNPSQVPPSKAPSEASVLAGLKGKGFSCTKVTGGTQCMGKLPTYPEPVAVLVPTGFRSTGLLALHLHGWVLGTPHDTSFEVILKDFSFLSLLKTAGRTDLLWVVPSSLGHCDTYTTFFSASGATARMLSEVQNVTGLPAKPSTLLISGHSGAYIPMDSMLRDIESSTFGAPDVTDVLLFDASYSALDPATYTSWLKRKSSRQLWVSFRPSTGTETGARALWTALSSETFSNKATNVWSPGRGEIFPSTSAGDGQDHWGMVRATLPRFLKGSRVERRSK